jgi:hypothetical protein
MTHTEQIVKLLSNHRQPHRPELPRPLSLRTIVTLLQTSLPPQQPSQISTQIQADLRELQAQGEVLAGSGNRFCMAPPTVLAEDEKNLSGLLFRGDRAYLNWAHQALATGQPHTKLVLHPKVQGFHRSKHCLSRYGIRFLTADASVEYLPSPALPQLSMLQGFEWNEPFQTENWTARICQYVPQVGKQQAERWMEVKQAELGDRSLLQLPTSDFLWFEANCFYELTPDMAALAMFQLDQSAGRPIQVPWDEGPGRLNLQDVALPRSHAQILWWLSQPDLDQSRTRLFNASKRPIARAVLSHLGCVLV